MPTLAQQRLAALAEWFHRNSLNGRTPNGGELSVGQYAAIVPTSFAEAPPIVVYHPDALPFFVSAEQSVGMSFDSFEPNAPDTQSQGDARLSWLAQDGKLPPIAIVGLTDPGEPISGAVERAGLAIDLEAVPVLAVPLWPLSDGARYRLNHVLPFAPKADAPDPDMPKDYVAPFVGVRDI